MKGKLLYLLLLAATVFWGLLYYSSALISLAVLEVLAAAASWTVMRFQISKIKVRICMPLSVTEKGERMEAGLELENNSRIPLVRAESQIRLKNLFYPETETIRLTGAVDAKSRVRILKGFVGEHCGPVELELGQVWVWDFLRIFKGRVKVTQKERWVILPRMYQAMIRPDEKIRNSPDDSEEYDKTRPGDDVSEIFQLREYRPGDRIQSVHWKRSAAREDLIVREYSLPVARPVALLLDLRWKEVYLDDFLEAGLAISRGLMEAGCPHYVAWMDAAKEDVSRLSMETEEDLYTLTEMLYRAGWNTSTGNLQQLYAEKYRGESLICCLRLDTDLCLWKDQELWRDLSENPKVILESGELLLG